MLIEPVLYSVFANKEVRAVDKREYLLIIRDNFC